MIKKKVREYFTGPMVGNMKVVGKTVNNTESEHIHRQVVKQNKDNGKMVKDSIGLQAIIVRNDE